jgi:hypothetical protein
MRGPRYRDYAPLPLSEKEPLSYKPRRDQQPIGLGIWALRAVGACVVLYGVAKYDISTQ